MDAGWGPSSLGELPVEVAPELARRGCVRGMARARCGGRGFQAKERKSKAQVWGTAQTSRRCLHGWTVKFHVGKEGARSDVGI